MESSHQVVRGHRTPHAYYTSLASLEEHLFRKVDSLVVVMKHLPLSAHDGNGFRDYRSRLHVVDRSVSGQKLSPIIVEISRWAKEALPQAEVGDVAILHDFHVSMRRRRLVLISGPTSSWAVIHGVSEVTMSGPPLEYGQAELNLTESLHHWWQCGADQFRVEEAKLESPEDD